MCQLTPAREFPSLNAAQVRIMLQNTELDTLPETEIKIWLDSLRDMSRKMRNPYCSWWIGYQSYLNRLVAQNNSDSVQLHLKGLLALADKHHFKAEAVIIKFYLAFDEYYTPGGNFPEEYNALIEVFAEMEKIGWSHFRPYRLPRLYRYIGRFYYEVGETDRALYYLEEGGKMIETIPYSHRNYIATCNLLQTIYKKQQNYDKAIEYAKKILDHLKHIQPGTREFNGLHDEWYCLSSIDLASMYLSRGQKYESEQLVDSCFARLQQKIRDNPNDLSQLLTEFDVIQALIPVKIALGKLPETARLLHRTEAINQIIDTLPKVNRFRNVQFYRNYAAYFEKIGNAALALQYYKWAEALNDSLETRNYLARSEQLDRLNGAYKLKAQLETEVLEYKSRNWLMLAGLLILTLLVVVVWLGYQRALSEKKLAGKEAELAIQKLGILNLEVEEKTELTHLLKAELETLMRKSEAAQQIERLRSASILTEADWSNFKALFQKVYPDFVQETMRNIPDLTQSELRYMLLEKLGMTSQEMAKVIGVSDVAIRQTRYRIRQKARN